MFCAIERSPQSARWAQHQDLGADVGEDTPCGLLVGDVGRIRGDAELLLHRVERGLLARHDGHLGTLVDLDKPEAQALVTEKSHRGLRRTALFSCKTEGPAVAEVNPLGSSPGGPGPFT